MKMPSIEVIVMPLVFIDCAHTQCWRHSSVKPKQFTTTKFTHAYVCAQSEVPTQCFLLKGYSFFSARFYTRSIGEGEKSRSSPATMKTALTSATEPPSTSHNSSDECRQGRWQRGSKLERGPIQRNCNSGASLPLQLTVYLATKFLLLALSTGRVIQLFDSLTLLHFYSCGRRSIFFWGLGQQSKVMPFEHPFFSPLKQIN